MRTSSKFALAVLSIVGGCFVLINYMDRIRFPTYTTNGLNERREKIESEKHSMQIVVPNQDYHRNRINKKGNDQDSQESVLTTRGEDTDTSTELDYDPDFQDLGLQRKNRTKQEETTLTSPRKDVKIKIGELPEWWKKSWAKSKVFGRRNDFVGDKPLFEPCTGPTEAKSSSATLYHFVEPPEEFLPPEVCKNPCWYQQPKTRKGLLCVPYVYMAGVAKCGTSDISKRLSRHPDFVRGTKKEYHWWERLRFGIFDEENPEESLDMSEGQTFKEYIQDLTGNELNSLQRELEENGSSVRIFADFSPSYMWDPQNWYAIEGNQGCQEPRMVAGQHIRHMWPDAKILMIFRHPTPRLYSRFMSRIHRTPSLKGVTVEDFHDFVQQSVDLYMTCFRNSSVRQCAYDVNLYRDSKVRLMEGMYPVFMEDWLRIWHRDQILILRTEDYNNHERDTILKIMDFLGLRMLNTIEMENVMEIPVVNSGAEEYEKYGFMLPKTKKLLDDFYQPFIDQFAEILNEERFLWKDTP